LAAVKTITIGGVDYSGFKAGATIDVSNFAGAASVVGSAFDDVITDNKGTNTLTGGAGADTFTFVTTNTGKTGATGDVITDFSEAGGDRIASGAGAVTAAEYGENTFTDFASFLSGADAADKNVFVGQVGTNLWVAVDSNQDNTVDYTIKLLGVSLAGIDLAAFV
jgi:Ca2+-binding RTX toxin-like protein